MHGGWQEARGAAISPQYTAPTLNNSYFIENIKEELDAEGEVRARVRVCVSAQREYYCAKWRTREGDLSTCVRY